MSYQQCFQDNDKINDIRVIDLYLFSVPELYGSFNHATVINHFFDEQKPSTLITHLQIFF